MRIYKTLSLSNNVSKCWTLFLITLPFLLLRVPGLNEFLEKIPFVYVVLTFSLLPLLSIIIHLGIYTYENRNYKFVIGKYWVKEKVSGWMDLPLSFAFGVLSLLIIGSKFVDPFYLPDYVDLVKWVGTTFFFLSIIGLVFSIRESQLANFGENIQVNKIKINPEFLVLYKDNWIQEFDLTKVEDLFIIDCQIEVKEYETSLSTKIDCRNFSKEDLEKLQDDFHASKRIRSAHLHGGYSFKELVEQRASKHWKK